MNWVDNSTLNNFMEDQRRRVTAFLWTIHTPEDNRQTDEPRDLGMGYTREELMRTGHIERRS